MDSKDGKKLNPRIHHVEIGIREIKEITLYPLSIADQLRMKELIGSAVLAAQSLPVELSVWLMFFLEQFESHGADILSLATGENGDKLLQEMDNMQFAEVGRIIFKQNYEDLVKNFKPSLVTLMSWMERQIEIAKEKGLISSVSSPES
jgi:hypothetical protein